MSNLKYRSGSAVGLVDFFQKLCDFVTSSAADNGAGWSLHFNSSSTDKVFISSGSDNQLNNIIRLSTHLSGVIDSKTNYHNIFSHVFARGYNSFGSDGVGTTQYGQQGPMLLQWTEGQTASAKKDFYIYGMCAKSINNISFGSSSLTMIRQYNGDGFINTTYDGHRYLVGINADDVSYRDIFRNENVILANSGTAFSSFVSADVVYDKKSGEQFVYVQAANVATQSQTKKLRVNNTSFDGLGGAHPTWGPGTPSTAGFTLWDGEDTVFFSQATSKFTKYDIPTQTFITCSNLGATKNTTVQFRPAFFITQSLMNHLTKSSSNIYLKFSAAVLLSNYNIMLDSWFLPPSSGAYTGESLDPAAAIAYNDKSTFFFVGDNNDNPHSNDIYYGDISNGYGTQPDYRRFSVGSPGTPGDSDPALLYFQNFPKVRANSTGSMNFWFLGDVDNVIVVTQPHTSFNGHFVMSFGRYDTFSNRKPMVVTANVAATGSVWVSVTLPEKYFVGESLTLFDKYSDNPTKTITIQEKIGNTIRVMAADTIRAGSLIGENPCMTCIFDGDDEFMTTNYQKTSGSCFDNNFLIEHMLNVSSSAGRSTATSGFAKTMLSPLLSYAGPLNESANNLSHGGFIKNVFGMQAPVQSSANDIFNERTPDFDYLNVDGKKFLLFKQFTKELMFRTGSSKTYENMKFYNYVIGPFGDV